jgi:hypothetical protein
LAIIAARPRRSANPITPTATTANNTAVAGSGISNASGGADAVPAISK